MTPRKTLINVSANDALTLYQLPPKFMRKHIDEINDSPRKESIAYLTRVLRLGYVRHIGEQDRAKVYEITGRGKAIAQAFGQLLMEAQ